MILEPVTEENLELMLAWRSIPEVYKFQETQDKPFKWEDHYNWFINRKNREDYFIIYEDRRIGIVNVIALNEDIPELGVYIGETTLWGNGLGCEAIKILMQRLQNKGYEKVCATTNKENERSNKLWQKLGFKREKEVKDGKEWLYICKF